MAREIIILDALQDEGGGLKRIRAVLWLIAPTNRIVVKPNFTSAVPLASVISWGITTGASSELAALQAGTTIEQFVEITSDLIPPPVNLANAQAYLGQIYTDRQNQLNAAALGIKLVGMARAAGAWGAAP